MKKEEIILGAFVYALIIAAGFFGPAMKKLGWGHWTKTIDLLAHENNISFVPAERSPAGPQPLGSSALKMKGVLGPFGRLSAKPLSTGMAPPFQQNRTMKEGSMAYRLKLKGTEPGFPKNTPMDVEVNPL